MINIPKCEIKCFSFWNSADCNKYLCKLCHIGVKENSTKERCTICSYGDAYDLLKNVHSIWTKIYLLSKKNFIFWVDPCAFWFMLDKMLIRDQKL